MVFLNIFIHKKLSLFWGDSGKIALMGKVEKMTKKRRVKRDLQNAVLSVVGAVGLITIAAVAPGVIKMFGPMVKKKLYETTYSSNKSLSKLIKKGLIEIKTENGVKYVSLTKLGRRKIDIENAISNPRTVGKKRWDKRYRLIIFDIPETKRKARDKFREYMHAFGFLRIQDSVWLSPYDCEELIDLLKIDLTIGRDVLYIITESIENDGWIREHFNID